MNQILNNPLQLKLLLSLWSINLIFLLVSLGFLLLSFKFKSKTFWLIILAIVLELLPFSTGNWLTVPLKVLQMPNLPISKLPNRYLSTADTVAYTGPHNYFNHLKKRIPFGSDLSSSELENFSRLSQEITLLPGNLNLYSHTANIAGYSAVVLKNYASWWGSGLTNSVATPSLEDDRIRQLGVTHLISGYPQDYLKTLPNLIHTSSTPEIYQYQTPFPRAYLESNHQPQTITTYLPEQVSIEVNASASDALVLTDSLYPGWNAYIDNQYVPTIPYQQAFRKVIVPSGHHTLQFRYQPRSVTIGSSITILTTIFLVTRLLWRKQK